jgi:hypothetical protein
MCDRSPSKAVAARYSAGQQVAVVGSEIRLFGKNKGVVYLDPEITNRAFQFRVSKQKLAGAQIAGSLVEERDLCPPEAVGPVRSRIEPDQGDPVIQQATILARSQVISPATTAREEPVVVTARSA